MKTSARTYEWRNAHKDLRAASVTLGEGKAASSLKLDLIDPRLELASVLPLPHRKTRIPVEVWFGYGTKLPKVFTGYMSSLTASGLPGSLSIVAVDKAKGLRRVSKSRNLTGASADAIIKKLVEEVGLKIDLTGAKLSDVAFASALQMGESNMDMISKLAKQCGHEVYVRGNTVFIKAVGYAIQDKVLRVPFGSGVANGFNFQVNEFTRSTTPNVFDIDGGRLTNTPDIELEAAEVVTHLANTGLVLASEGTPEFTSQAEQRSLKAQAKAKRLFEASISFTRAYPDLDVDWQLLLENWGPRFSGAWNIESVEHDLVNGTTSVQIYNGGSSG